MNIIISGPDFKTDCSLLGYHKPPLRVATEATVIRYSYGSSQEGLLIIPRVGWGCPIPMSIPILCGYQWKVHKKWPHVERT